LENRRILPLLPNKPHTSSTKAVTLLADINWLMNRYAMNNNKGGWDEIKKKVILVHINIF